MSWWLIIPVIYLVGLGPTFVISAKYKQQLEREWCPWKIFTFLWPLCLAFATICMVFEIPGIVGDAFDKVHNHLSRWLNAPKTKPLPKTKEELFGEAPPFSGGYRDSAGVKCPSCHRNM